ncbi:hypothetical protein ACSBR1_012439 [Camellia fascicularis]
MSWLIWLHQLILVSLLFSQVVTCSSSWSSSTSAHHMCLEDQQFSLLQFKKTFTITSGLTFPECESYSHPKMVFWNESIDCCSWDGVTCDWLNGHVIGLDLSCSELQGTIQGNSSLFHLRQLQRLNLAFNDFSFSKILSRFGSFTSLTYLNLSNSLFAGPIPSEICHLSKLISLDMSNYNSQWTLEQHTFNMILQNLTQLKELHLDWVDISSPLPHALLNLSSLTSLSLGFCQLHGKFLENIFHLPNLQKLIVQYNGDLTGKLPNFNVTSSLQFLDLSWTSFSGQLPDSIDNLKALNRFYVSSSNFSGSIPASFWNLTKITSLDFSHNVFSGQMPSSILNLAKLIDLDLSVNNFSGQIPNSIGNMSQLAFLDLSGNQLIGPIPLYAVGLSKLTFLGLSNNSLNGTLPSWLFAQPLLVSIDLRNNRLQGPIPRSIYELANLTYLDLSSNNLGGVVELDKLLKLKYLSLLDLSYNGLSLSINNSLNSTALPSLEIIGLGSCNLTEFPNFLREQAGLFSLDLSNNKIHGEVPKWVLDVGKFSLTRLDLSHNFLSAGLEQLPWLALQYIDLHDNLLHGPLPVPPITTTVFLISSNKFIGKIPPLICGLGLLKVLDLSNNSLSGMIPQCLGNLSNSLSVLNLRMNSFHGAFTAIFTKGSTLRNLNLNDNQIEGQVPRSLLNCGRLEVLDLGRNKINDTFPYWLELFQSCRFLS